MPSSTLRAAGLLAVARLAVTGCAANGTDGTSSGTAKVIIELTGDGCRPSPAEVAAGPVTFEVKNAGANKVTEAELLRAGAHIRLAAPENNGGIRILRRGYSFTDGISPASGDLDAGLFFIAFQKDPHRQFVALQRRLGQADALNEYIQHVGSGLFACPPGSVDPARYWADGLLA